VEVTEGVDMEMMAEDAGDEMEEGLAAAEVGGETHLKA